MLLHTFLTVALILYILASILLLVYGINSYLMIGLHLRSRRKRVRDEGEIVERFATGWRDSDLPIVTTQLPVYNEANVVERLVRAVCAFDYPRDRHEIQVLDDSTDETTEIASDLVERLRAEGHDIHHLHRMDRRGFKAGALEQGLKAARGEYAAVFDADFVPPPDFLRNTVPFLAEDPECGFVQTRWGHRNRGFSLLTRLQGIGIDGHFVIEQTARAWNGLFCNFNGTAGLWRIRTIREAGGWRADTLTEDLDLSYRSILAGWKPRYLMDVITPAEIPTDINALKSQQRRWAKGSIQTAIKLLPTVLRRRDLGLFKKIQAALHLTHYMIHPLILILTILILPLIHLLQMRFALALSTPLVGVMLLAMFGPSTLYVFSQALTRQSWKRAVLLMPALIAMGIGLAVNNSRAILDAFLGRRGEFVRTPKLGAVVEKRAVRGSPGGFTGGCKIYRQPLSRLYLVEIFMGAWALAAFLGYLFAVGAFPGFLLLLQAIGFTCVGVLSIRHHRYAGKPG